MKKYFKNKSRVVSFCIAAMALVVGAGIFLGQVIISNINAEGVIKDPYVEGDPIAYSGTNDTGNIVTLEKDEDAEVLTSENKALPKIPGVKDSEGNYAKKGTASNPFVVLEIVPDQSQRAISYLVSSPEEGLPYDPMQFGSNAMRTIKMDGYSSFVDFMCSPGYFSSVKGLFEATEKENGLDGVSNKFHLDVLNQKFGGPFAQTESFEIYDPNNTKNTVDDEGNKVVTVPEKGVKADYIKNYYTVTLAPGTISDSDFNLSVKELKEKYEGYNLFDIDDSGNSIKSFAVEDDANWARLKSDTPAFSYEVQIPSDVTFDPETTKVSEFAANHSELFEEVSSEYLKSQYDLSWENQAKYTIEWDASKASVTSGYLKYVGPGNGDFTLLGTGGQWNPDSDKNANNQKAWKYVADATPAQNLILNIPQNDTNYFSNNVFNSWNNSWKNEANFQGRYVKIGDESGCIKGLNAENILKLEGYTYTYKYYGLAIRDILKYRLFRFESEEEYDKFHIKVISLTPSEINEMDCYDTEKTIDYVERADMFYVAAFDKNDSEGAQIVNLPKIMNASKDEFETLYNNFNKNQGKDDAATYKTYFDNDLEWDDCMKIMYRLCTQQNLPILYENVVGDLLNKGVNQDGSATHHIRLNKDNTCYDQVGSLNNMAKLYLVTTQMDLTSQMVRDLVEGEKNFFRDIYPEFKKIRVAIPQSVTDEAEKIDKNEPQKPVKKASQSNEEYQILYDQWEEDYSNWRTEQYNKYKDTDAYKAKYTARYTGYYERFYGDGQGACACTDQTAREKAFYLWGKAMFLPDKVITDQNELVYKADPDTGEVLNPGYGYSRNYIESKSGKGADLSNSKFGKPGEVNMQAATDVFEDENANVVIVYEHEGDANPNMTILHNNSFNRVGKLAEWIISNTKKDPERMAVTILKNKDEYTKFTSTDIMLFYNQGEKYKGARNIVLNLKLNVENFENIPGIISKITFINENDSTKNISYYPGGSGINQVYDKVYGDSGKNLITKSITVSSKDKLITQADISPVTGLAIDAKSSLDICLPFTLQQWCDGYTKIEVTTYSRSQFTALNGKEKIAVHGPDKTVIGILGESLFDLR